MKTIKCIDLGISILLIGWFTLKVLFEGTDLLITAYFIVGGWQSLSMILHAVMGWFTRKNSVRFNYHWVAFISVITMPAGSIWVLLYVAPFMALFYAGLCAYEIKYLYRKRPLSLLK